MGRGIDFEEEEEETSIVAGRFRSNSRSTCAQGLACFVLFCTPCEPVRSQARPGQERGSVRAAEESENERERRRGRK